jgi:hypothetical protein
VKNNPWEEKRIRTKFKEYVFGILHFSAEVEKEKHTQQNYTSNTTYRSRYFSVFLKICDYQMKS